MTKEQVSELKWSANNMIRRGLQNMIVDPEHVLYLIESFESLERLLYNTADDIQQITQMVRESKQSFTNDKAK